MNSFIITSTGINVFFDHDSSQHTIKHDHPRYADITRMAAEGNFDDILTAIDIRAAVDNFIYNSTNGRFNIDGGVLTFDGTTVHTSLADRMVDMAVNGLDITAMEKFMVNLMANPSYRAVTELYNFLEAGNLPITPDGYFLAYKKIRDDYKDCHSGTMDNSIGATVTMPRNQVNEDRDKTCSTGLHFCSHDYLSHFGGSRVVVLKINPRDVVSIPADYNDTKGRACQYEVLRELENYREERIEGYVSANGMYDDDEYDEDGYDPDGYDPDGYDEYGYDEDGYDRNDYDVSGFDRDGFNDDGFDQNGYDIDGYDINGYDHYGVNDEGNIQIAEEYSVGATQTNLITSGFVPPQKAEAVAYINAMSGVDDEDEDDADDVAATEQVKAEKIKAVDMRNKVTYVFDSIEEAHAETNVPVEYIKRVLKGQKGSSLGFTFDNVKV